MSPLILVIFCCTTLFSVTIAQCESTVVTLFPCHDELCATASSSPSRTCDVTPLQADRCARTMMFEGDRDRFVPRNEKEMDKHCRIFSDSLKCMERHSRCYKSLSRQLFALGVRHMKRAHRVRCKTPNGRKEFLKHVSCIHNETTSEPIHACVDKWTWMINFVLKNVTDNNKHFTSACCSFHLFEKCLLTEANALCIKRTGPGTATYIRDVIKDGVAEFMDLACNKVRSVADCRTHEPAITRVFEQQMKAGVERQSTSALFPFLQLATKLDN